MRLRTSFTLALAFLVAWPSVALAVQPVDVPPTIVAEGFESDTPTTYTTEKLALNDFATGVQWWGRVSTQKRAGLYSLWCAGSPPRTTTSTTRYAEGTSGKTRFALPQLADYYSAKLRFHYLLPSRGTGDHLAFSVHSRPAGPDQRNHNRSDFAITTLTAWKDVEHDLTFGANNLYPISRVPGEVWFQWVDSNEEVGAPTRTGRGVLIDDVAIVGWKYGPVRDVSATVDGQAVHLSWAKPFARVGTSVEETRAVVYDILRRPTAGSTWTLVQSGRASQEMTVTGLSPSTPYTFAVQARDTHAQPGYGEHVSVQATTGVGPVEPGGGIVTRVAGSDRFAVAEGLARRGWDPAGTKAWAGVDDVIIANGENGKEADPLAAAGLAGVYDAPVLLTQAARLPVSTKRVLTEIAAKNPGVRVHVIGGTATIPVARWSEIKAIPGVSKVDYRIAGRDRYDVTALIAKRMASQGGVTGALIVNAENPAAFYDALAVSPQAYAGRWALLGVRAGSVPKSVASVLSGPLAGKPRKVVNATTYVNAAVYSAVGANARYATTTDRYTAATQIAGRVDAESECSPSNVGVAAMLPDALTGGVFLGKRAGVMLFTDSSSALRPVTKTYITAHAAEIAQGWVLGGTASVPAGQATTFGTLIR